MTSPSDCDSHDGPPQDSPGAPPPLHSAGPHGDGRAQLPGGGGGRVWAVSHRLHGGVSDGDGPRDDAQQGLSLQKCDKVGADQIRDKREGTK